VSAPFHAAPTVFFASDTTEFRSAATTSFTLEP
jgi:hypothetical protein